MGGMRGQRRGTKDQGIKGSLGVGNVKEGGKEGRMETPQIFTWIDATDQQHDWQFACARGTSYHSLVFTR